MRMDRVHKSMVVLHSLGKSIERSLSYVHIGMTEATCIVTRIKWPETDFTGSVGRPIPNIDMKYVFLMQRSVKML